MLLTTLNLVPVDETGCYMLAMAVAATKYLEITSRASTGNRCACERGDCTLPACKYRGRIRKVECHVRRAWNHKPGHRTRARRVLHLYGLGVLEAK